MAEAVLSHAIQRHTLPERPNLEYLRNEAKARLKTLRVSDPTAQLSKAQKEVARKYGFSSWRRLRAEVQKLTGQTSAESTADKVERLAAEQALPRKARPIDPTTLGQFIGFYQLAPKSILTIERDEDGLMSRLTGQTFYSLLAESPTKFFYRNSLIKAQLSFERDDIGAVISLELHQNGIEQSAPRISREKAAAVEQSIEARKATNEPRSGSEQALRRIIKATQLGVSEPDLMAAGLARAFEEQIPDNKRALKRWGELKSIQFRGISMADDCDVYNVKFEQAETEWRLSLNDASRIEMASFRIVP
ncbi:protein of unknown function [Methylobacterium sp. 275MFSha3.1]|jgi:hypothetical protein|uniref:DUF3471 domain-containing protein n=1 Tax=Methylobacterium sp. 275MFSha3.1 TaxID=1502746 RepID=UPI0008A75637|nr:DUF3471 domain-containing protein [Methylobacterium sp. 275MFSha3.1]SEI11971.1 protein of unknown function [Methylobacterium sp. 275MFSha3.1]